MHRTGPRAALALALSALLFSACNFLSSQPDDKAISSELQARLYQDPALKTRDIRVVSEKGVIVLTGTVNTELEKTAVEQFANQVKGVKQVINQLAVSGSAAAPSPAPEALEPPPSPAPRRAARRASSRSSAASTSTAPSAAPSVPAVAPEETKPAEHAVASPPPAPEPRRITIPAGTVITVRTIDPIDTSRNRPGEQFTATLESPVVVGNSVVIQRGGDARVRLVQSASAGRLTGTSELQLELIGLTVNGNTYNVESSYYEVRAASRSKRTAETVGGGAGLGALIGAIAGKGKGAAIGAAVGAGAGTATQAATRGQQAKVPSETKIDFTLKAPITVTF